MNEMDGACSTRGEPSENVTELQSINFKETDHLRCPRVHGKDDITS